MKIVCAGMHRSGSTWLFNVVRVIFMENKATIYSCFANKYDPENDAPFHIVKAHQFKQNIRDGANCIFTTCRDLRDVAASAVRRNLVENTPESVERYLKEIVEREYEPWHRVSNYEVKYEEMYQQKPIVISKIAKKLGVYADPVKVAKTVESLSIPSDPGGFDETTQLHYNHITNGIPNNYSITLSKGVIATINLKFSPWLKRKGYIK